MAHRVSVTTGHGPYGEADVDQSRDDEAAVVVLRGEHDLATVGAIADAFVDAIGSGPGDLVVDLSDVDFMDASTVGVLLRSRLLLRHQARTLTLRAPSGSARHVLLLCGIVHLFEPNGSSSADDRRPS